MGIKSWLELSQSKFGGHQSDLVPLYINGMTKTGKSLTANEFLLSGEIKRVILIHTITQKCDLNWSLFLTVVRDDPVFGVGRPKEVSVFRLCMDYLSRNYGIRLEELLLRIIQWVEAESLPLSPASVLDDAKAAVYNRYGKEHIQEEITLLLAAIQVPTLMIIDESHLWFRPTDLEDNVDKPARREAGLFFKDLLTSQGNGRTLWVFTANKMATFWAGLASVPTNGTPLTLHKWQIDLPISTPNTLMQLFWGESRCRYVSLSLNAFWFIYFILEHVSLAAQTTTTGATETSNHLKPFSSCPGSILSPCCHMFCM